MLTNLLYTGSKSTDKLFYVRFKKHTHVCP